MFDWKEYFKLAKQLSKSKNEARSKSKNEARKRSAVSRAYYAAFCTARNHAATIGYTISRTGADHGELPKFYMEINTKFPGVGQKLVQLRYDRNCCDYDNKVQGIDKKVEESMLVAQSILSKIS